MLERTGVLYSFARAGGGGGFVISLWSKDQRGRGCSATNYWFPAAGASVQYNTSTQTNVTTQTMPGGPRITLVDPCHLSGFLPSHSPDMYSDFV